MLNTLTPRQSCSGQIDLCAGVTTLWNKNGPNFFKCCPKIALAGLTLQEAFIKTAQKVT